MTKTPDIAGNRDVTFYDVRVSSGTIYKFALCDRGAYDGKRYGTTNWESTCYGLTLAADLLEQRVRTTTRVQHVTEDGNMVLRFVEPIGYLR